jgi:hypothetical protein
MTNSTPASELTVVRPGLAPMQPYRQLELKPFPLPVVRAEDYIPHGNYCYVPKKTPSAENGFVYQVSLCRYHKTLPDYPDQMSGWCDYLKTGDMAPNGTDLLWDSVKECGIKTEESLFD